MINVTNTVNYMTIFSANYSKNHFGTLHTNSNLIFSGILSSRSEEVVITEDGAQEDRTETQRIADRI